MTLLTTVVSEGMMLNLDNLLRLSQKYKSNQISFNFDRALLFDEYASRPESTMMMILKNCVQCKMTGHNLKIQCVVHCFVGRQLATLHIIYVRRCAWERVRSMQLLYVCQFAKVGENWEKCWFFSPENILGFFFIECLRLILKFIYYYEIKKFTNTNSSCSNISEYRLCQSHTNTGATCCACVQHICMWLWTFSLVRIWVFLNELIQKQTLVGEQQNFLLDVRRKSLQSNKWQNTPIRTASKFIEKLRSNTLNVIHTTFQ